MQYMAVAASLAATHSSKVKNIRLSTLRDTSSVSDPRSAILDFEKQAHKYNNSMKDIVEGMYHNAICIGFIKITFYNL